MSKSWFDVSNIVINGIEYTTVHGAAEYLAMHEKSFLRLAKQQGVIADRKLGVFNLYTRSTLDGMQAKRIPSGRPSSTLP